MLKSYIKFFLKMRLVRPLRSFFLFLWRAPVNTDGWENRILLVNLLSLGDLVVFTSVLKHYKKRFPGKKIYLLVKSGLSLEKFFIPQFVDEIIPLDYRKFASNPFYGAVFINRLRRVGFAKVINQDFSASEIMGKIISLELNAREIVGYEGLGLEWRAPFDWQQKKNLEIVKEKILPRFSVVIKSIDAEPPQERLPSAVSHYAAIYEGATGFREDEYVPTLGDFVLAASGGSAPGGVLEKFQLKSGEYAIFNVGASVSYKRWPPFRFSKVAEFLESRGIKIALVGARSDAAATEEFKNVYSPKAVNFAGKTSLPELVTLVKNCLFVFTNDTSLAHFAVALKKPSVCVSGGGQFGMFQNYGYADINKWLWSRTDCYFDSWRCGRGLPHGAASPCVERVSLSLALRETKALINYLSETKSYPQESFRKEFAGEAAKPAGGDKLKIIYAGLRNENYNAARAGSFEYENFYLTLRNMPGVDVIEYPYDPVVKIGREKFNAELLSLVKAEKPDLFFAFMYTDELLPRTLLEIKKITKSAAWFADDYWRFWNYSRHWPPYFTKVITTYSRAVQWYKNAGFNNAILSQWACNTSIYKLLNTKKDIDVGFVGQKKSGRAKAVAALRRAGINVQCLGFGWPGGKISREEALKFFARSKICLNLTDRQRLWDPSVAGRIFFRKSINRIVPDFHIIDNLKTYAHFAIPHTHARPLELAGCGAFVISGWSEDIGKFYRENEEMVFYKNTEELIEKVKHYLPLDSERGKIAAAGYERTLREHTYEKRFREIFNQLSDE